MAKILICDDAIFMRQTLKRILDTTDHQVVAEAGGGQECIEKCKLFTPDIILMDITMDDMNGIEATKQIKAFDSNVKIIMVSAMGQQEKVFQAISSGAIDFIVKPFQPETVIACIQKYV